MRVFWWIVVGFLGPVYIYLIFRVIFTAAFNAYYQERFRFLKKIVQLKGGVSNAKV